MTKLRKAEIALDAANIFVILWFGYVGIREGLAEHPVGSVAAVFGLYWFGMLLREQRKNRKLSERLLDEEMDVALRTARTVSEVQANCKEIEHKIDVGYYQGK